MATSKTAICQRALARLGCTTNLANIETDTTQEAKLCRIFYDQALLTILNSFDWPFAKTAPTELALISTDLIGKWKSHYAYPADAVRLLNVYPIDNISSFDSTYEILNGTAGKVIASNHNTVIYCEYIKLEDDVTKYPIDFEDALCYLLASELALGLNKAMNIAAAMGGAYLNSLAMAKSKQKNENRNPGIAPILIDRLL